MKTKKPRVPTTYVQAKDAHSPKRRCKAFYFTTPDEIMDALEKSKPGDGKRAPAVSGK